MILVYGACFYCVGYFFLLWLLLFVFELVLGFAVELLPHLKEQGFPEIGLRGPPGLPPALVVACMTRGQAVLH